MKVTFEEFIELHGPSVHRLCKTDEAFNEVVVLRFKDYVAKYDESYDVPLDKWVLLQIHYHLRKYTSKELAWRVRNEQVHDEHEIDIRLNRDELTDEDKTELYDAIHKLDPDINVVVWSWACGFTQPEISRHLHIPVQQVRQKLHAGLDTLRRLMR
jgi:RNA polymerase sigma factor (sigma-70 family)